jgi:FHA domain-containing protein
MLSPVSVGLKFGFLAVLYLFLMWVALSSFFDLRRGAKRASAPAAEGTGLHDAPAGVVGVSDLLEPRLVVDHAAGHEPGIAYDLSRPVTLGRGDVEIQLDDQFASSHHARISRQGHAVVLEDLGSTNGTFLNDEPLTGPQPLHDGDRIRIGDSQFTYLQ